MTARGPVGEVALHVERAGQGPPVVLLHGWSSSSRAFASVFEHLARRHRVLAPDLRGHGRSAAPAAGYAMADHAADVTALLEREDVNGGALVGWSMGAQVALEALPSSRRRIAALVLVSGTPRFTICGDWPHGLREARVRALARQLAQRPERTLRAFFEGMFVSGEVDAACALEIQRSAVASAPPPSLAAARAGLDAFIVADQRARVDEVAVPALLVHGERDPVCLPGAARWMADRIPGARLALLPGLGHAPQLSRPELVSDLILGFLAEALPS
jgi:pimeloyl-ACP methyl ester esterase